MRAGAWTFRSDAVAAAFDRHVSLSVPEYDGVQALVARLAAWFLVDGGVVLDWGCSTGRTIAEVAAANPSRRVRYVGIDESAEMIARARARLGALPDLDVELRAVPLAMAPPPPSTCLVLALYSLQFLPPAARLAALREAASGLEAGGALVVVEKVLPADPALAGPFQELLHDEKQAAGYSPAEVAAKARALRGVLRPMAIDEWERALAAAGFRVTRFWQHLLFAGWICVRT